jgi:hypothetical protein
MNKYKKNYKQPKPNLMNRVNKLSKNNNGEKIINLKIQGHKF